MISSNSAEESEEMEDESSPVVWLLGSGSSGALEWLMSMVVVGETLLTKTKNALSSNIFVAVHGLR